MDKATLYSEAAVALRELAKAERESAKLAKRRGTMGFETPRTRRVQTGCSWTAAAEDRDRKLKRAMAALEAAGLTR